MPHLFRICLSLFNNPLLKDREWKLSAYMFSKRHGSVLQYSPVWQPMHTSHGWLLLQLIVWGKAQHFVWLGIVSWNAETPYPAEDLRFTSCSLNNTVMTVTPQKSRGVTIQLFNSKMLEQLSHACTATSYYIQIPKPYNVEYFTVALCAFS